MTFQGSLGLFEGYRSESQGLLGLWQHQRESGCQDGGKGGEGPALPTKTGNGAVAASSGRLKGRTWYWPTLDPYLGSREEERAGRLSLAP